MGHSASRSLVDAVLSPRFFPVSYDVVFIRRPGPALHHYGYIVGGINDIIRACDLAGRLGYGDHVEFGPGRHSPGHSYCVYLLDPDCHRVELLPPAIYYGDADEGPVVHDLTGVPRVTESWGLPPRSSWLKNARRRAQENDAVPGVPLSARGQIGRIKIFCSTLVISRSFRCGRRRLSLLIAPRLY